MLNPIVIPGPMAAAYILALVIAVLGMAVWTFERSLSATPGRHRSAANIAEADAITAALTGEIIAADADIDPAPELAAQLALPPAPRDALDPAMPIEDVEALLALYASTRELASV